MEESRRPVPPAVEGVVLDMPGEGDLTPLGVMHLRSWHQTYPDAEHGVDARWIDEHMGFVASPAAVEFRRGVLAAQRAHPGRTFYRVARAGGEVVGFVHASRPGPTDDGAAAGAGAKAGDAGEDALLDALYLLRHHQGTGLADRMMAAVLEWLGDRPMRLEVAGYNARAIAFYRRHGFRLTAERGLFRERVPIAVMRRSASDG